MGSVISSIGKVVSTAEGVAHSPLGFLLRLVPGVGGVMAALPAIEGILAAVQLAETQFGVSNGEQKLKLAVQVAQATVPALGAKTQAEVAPIINAAVAFLNSLEALPTSAGVSATISAAKASVPLPAAPVSHLEDPLPSAFKTTTAELDAQIRRDAQEG